MVPSLRIAQAVLADPALLERLLEDVGIIIEAGKRIHDAAHALTAPATTSPAAASAAIPELSTGDAASSSSSAAAEPTDNAGAARVFDVSQTALENYDAEQLVALRKDHAAVDHDTNHCIICQVLARRLGSARP